MPPAMLAAATMGISARVENSNSSNSMASTTDASGAPNVAAMPAAAPAASKILRSDGDPFRTWPMSEPSEPPETMSRIGPQSRYYRDTILSLNDADYEALARFRYALRVFLHFSEQAARAEGLTPMQHQLLLAVRGHPGEESPMIAELAESLQLR